MLVVSESRSFGFALLLLLLRKVCGVDWAS